MKKLVLFVIALAFAFALAVLADTPVYSVSNNMLYFDIDNDGSQDVIELTADTDGGTMHYIDINISKNNVLSSHFTILRFDSLGYTPDTLIRLYPHRISGENMLFIETHLIGAESITSSWMMMHYKDAYLHFTEFCQDPGWSSGVAIYAGHDPVDDSSYLLYSSDFGGYSEYAYLNTLESRFSKYNIEFDVKPLSIGGGWYSAATIDKTPSGALAIEQSHKDMNAVTNQGSGSSSSSSTGIWYSISVTGDEYVRNAPNKDASYITVLKKGATPQYLGVTRFDDRGVAWHYVSTPAGMGWISSKYCKNTLTDGLIPTTLQGKVVTTASVNIRKGPYLKSEALGSVKKNTEFTFLNEIDVDDRDVCWFKVKYNNNDAWVSSKYSKLK